MMVETWNQEFQQVMIDRGLKEPAQQRNPYSQVANAIRVLDPQHFALDIICLPSEFHTQFNAARAGDLEHRLPKFITSDAATDLVARSHQLLQSQDWPEVAAALAVLLGRRVGEILLGQYHLESDWTVRVEGIFKRLAGEPSLQVLIPTLVPAPLVINAISRLQSHCDLSDLHLEDKDLQQQKRLVNSRFSQEVSLACKRLFAGMVPARETDDPEGSKLYTHLFRAVYATIAAHWFCPPQIQHEHYFKAHIQGHYKWVPSVGWQVSLNSRANYDDYLIGDGLGNRDGRLGIKLAELGVEALPVGAVQFQEEQSMAFAQQTDKPPVTLDSTSSDAISEPIKADSLVEQEIDLAIAQLSSPPDTASGQSVPDEITDDSAEIPQVDVPTAASTPEKRHKPKRRLKQLSVDCEQLRRVAHSFGIDVLGGRGQGYEQAISQLLTRLEDVDPSPPAPDPDVTAAMAAQARTLDWLTREVDTLRQQVASLQAERDRAVSQVEQPHPLQQEFKHLKAENSRLRLVEQKFEHLKQTFFNDTQQEQAVPEPPQEKTSPPPVPSTDPIAPPVAPRKQRSAKPAVPQQATATLAIADDKHESIRQMLRAIVRAIMHFNLQQSYKDDKIRIGFDPVKTLATHYGVNNQQRIKEVFNELAVEIEHHHQTHQLSPRHNTGKDYSQLPQLISVA